MDRCAQKVEGIPKHVCGCLRGPKRIGGTPLKDPLFDPPPHNGPPPLKNRVFDTFWHLLGVKLGYTTKQYINSIARKFLQKYVRKHPPLN